MRLYEITQSYRDAIKAYKNDSSFINVSDNDIAGESGATKRKREGMIAKLDELTSQRILIYSTNKFSQASAPG